MKGKTQSRRTPAIAPWRARRAPWSLLLVLYLTLLPTAGTANTCAVREDVMLAEASEHTVEIDADYSGKEILFFGVTECPGDVVLVVRGPLTRLIVSRKTRVAAIWINGEERVFERAPALYAVASTQPLDELLSLGMRTALGIGVDALRLSAREGEVPMPTPFRNALLKERQARALYTLEPISVRTVREKLFRASVWFPPNAPTGQYAADFYYVRNKAIVGSYTVPLSVEKTGLEGLIHEFAHDLPAAYGLAAIGLALGSGWLIGSIFRKR